MTTNALDYRHLADRHRPADEAGHGQAVRQLAAQGLTPRDIASHLRLDPGAVRRLLAIPSTEDTTMKFDPRTSPAAAVGGPNSGDMTQRTAVQERHSREAFGNVLKSRAPSEVLTPDERKTIERSKGGV